MGRVDEALAMMRKVLTMEPLNASFHFYTGQYLLAQGRVDEAETELKRAVELQPSAEGVRLYLTLAYIERDRFDEALATAATEPNESYRRFASTMTQFALGDTAAGQASLADMVRLDADFGPGYIADVYAYLGDADQAFAWLERAWQSRDTYIATLYEDPILFPKLRNDPRFAAFCRKVGLPPPDQVQVASASS